MSKLFLISCFDAPFRVVVYLDLNVGKVGFASKVVGPVLAAEITLPTFEERGEIICRVNQINYT